MVFRGRSRKFHQGGSRANWQKTLTFFFLFFWVFTYIQRGSKFLKGRGGGPNAYYYGNLIELKILQGVGGCTSLGILWSGSKHLDSDANWKNSFWKKIRIQLKIMQTFQACLFLGQQIHPCLFFKIWWLKLLLHILPKFLFKFLNVVRDQAGPEF